jgi:hypothetical protein
MKKLIPVIAFSLLLGTSCNNAQKQAEIEAQQRALDSMKNAIATQKIIDSMNAVAAYKADSIRMEKEKTAAATTTRRRSSGGGSAGTSNTYNTYNQGYAGAAPAPAPQQKKGWSSTAKGALIGAGVGALGGALISDKKGQGALIGGAAGAGVGAGTGAIIDASKRKREQQQR